MTLIGKLFRFAVDTAVILTILLYLPGLPPFGEFKSYTIPVTPAFEGVLGPNDFELNRVEKLFEDELVGPEALEESPVEPGAFYSGLQGGAIVRFQENASKMKPVAKFGDKCGGIWDPKTCGRPAGMKFDREGRLVVADAYLGIIRVDFQKGETTTLVPQGTEIEGKVNKFFNDVAVTSNGLVYYSVSSTNYQAHEAIGELLGAPSGRILVYDPVANSSRVLVDGSHFPNGILSSPNEDYLVYSECLQYRLMKYWLQGPKKGTSEIFADGLPGMPDNLSLSPEGKILSALVSVRLPDQSNPLELLYKMPLLRKVLLRIIHLMKLPLDLIDTYLQLPMARQISHHVLNLESLSSFAVPYSMVLELDWDGRITRSWHSNAKDIAGFSQAKIIDGYMYLGSPANRYLGRLKLDPSDVDQPLLTLG